MVNELVTIQNCGTLVSRLHVPLKIILAGNDFLTRYKDEWMKNANIPKEATVIDGATHCFDEEGKEKQLFVETREWIKRF